MAERITKIGESVSHLDLHLPLFSTLKDGMFLKTGRQSREEEKMIYDSLSRKMELNSGRERRPLILHINAADSQVTAVSLTTEGPDDHWNELITAVDITSVHHFLLFSASLRFFSPSA